MKKLGLVTVASAGVLALLSACGGSSKSSAFQEADGGSPDTGTGGSKAGSSTAEGGEGPATGGSSKGGSTNGGSANAGGKASGGSGGAVFVPDPAVRAGCDGWCADVVGAACNDDTLADCLLGCRAVSSSPACNAKYGELFACAKDATFTCNNDGDAVPGGCEIEYANAGLCVLSNPDTTIEEPCTGFCAAAEAADCMNSSPAGECTYGCELTSSLIPTCAADWKTFIECAADAEVTCNEDGDAVPGTCGGDYLRYAACVLDAGQ